MFSSNRWLDFFLRNRRAPLPLAIGGVLGGLLILFFLPFLGPQPLPDFSSIEDIGQRKAAFFSYLEPFIERANARILRDRERLDLVIRRLGNGYLGRRNERWARSMVQSHGLDVDPEEPLSVAILERLRLRMDVIPPSLALAQAALESGWGTSRFARQGNNLFGIWCHEPGCGIVPRKRPPGATYEVARYSSPKGCFQAYLRNLNSNPAYESLWLLREQSRLQGEPPSGLQLADGLYRYSQEQWRYVSKVKTLIRSNGLQRFD
ncbi:MAG: glucosaminidase domain-containing protein [Oceanipulchritudo sp.]